MSKTLNQQLGEWGEEMACKYLKGKEYTILDRNFRKKWGEIDIICLVPSKIEGIVPRGTMEEKLRNEEIGNTEIVPRGTFIDKVKRFFEIKSKRHPMTHNSVQHRMSKKLKRNEKIVFVEVKTLQSKLLRPEENVTPAKQKRIIRSCQLYLETNDYSVDTDWQIDVIGILLDKETGKAKIEHIEQAVYFN